MNLYDLVMSALGPTALVLPSLDQTDSFSRHSDDTKHSSSSGMMISANDDDNPFLGGCLLLSNVTDFGDVSKQTSLK